MLAKERLITLAERKQLLILEAELNRGLIKTEWAALRLRFDSVRNVRTRFPIGTPWLAAGSALAALLAVRRWRVAAKLLPIALAGWRWFRSFKT